MVHLDLNLLVALDALLEEGSVGGAARRLHLSAPAMSRTLGRIRTVTGDAILVRTGRTMAPTPFAAGVRERVHALVAEAQTVLAPERELDLATLSRTFALQAHDGVTTAIGPWLLEAVRTQAPHVALRLLPEQAVDTLELKHGHLDLEIGSGLPTLPEIRSETLLRDRLVVAMRAGHPLDGPPLTRARFAAADHVIVSRRGRLEDPIDAALEAAGLRRRVVASAPTSTAALHFAAAGDLLVVVSDRLCRPAIAALGLRTVPVPLDLEPLPLVVAWHERYEDDRAHAWLRSLVVDAVARVSADGDDASA